VGAGDGLGAVAAGADGAQAAMAAASVATPAILSAEDLKGIHKSTAARRPGYL